jgi:hypothetical protein
LPWNQWQASPGIGGNFAVEYATEIAQRLHQHASLKFLLFARGDVDIAANRHLTRVVQAYLIGTPLPLDLA